MKPSIFLCSLITLVIFGLISYFFFALSPAASGSSLINLEVRSGESLDQIAAGLKDRGIIRSKLVFKLYAAVSGSAHLLKPGDYLLDAGSSTPLIIDELLVGTREKTITLTEGMSLKDIDFRLSSEGILPKQAISRFNWAPLKKDYGFLASAKSLEGFLFPDTYRFFRQSTPEEVIRKLLDNFREKAWPILKTQKDFQEKLILASLVEKEVPAGEDRKIVAGILIKRLAIGIPLQVDATVSYAKCGGAFLSCPQPQVFRKDLQIASPYNTYLHYGLPPTAIGNPGTDAVNSVINPEKSDYLYYLSDPKSGKIIYAQTLDQHNENRAKYLSG